MNIRPSPGSCPILDAFSMAATLKGGAAESSKLELHNAREAQDLSLDEESASQGGPTNRIKKLGGTARAPAEIRECMDSGRGLNNPGLSDRSLACVSSGLKNRSILSRPKPHSRLASRGTCSSAAEFLHPSQADLSHVSLAPRSRTPARLLQRHLVIY